jgi:hypothetical protein
MEKQMFDKGIAIRREILGTARPEPVESFYCGVPAAVDSFRIAREVFQEMGI